MKLYLVLLGGKIDKKLFGEDHQTIIVVAKGITEAKKIAKDRWIGISENLHVDDVREITALDGYKIVLQKS